MACRRARRRVQQRRSVEADAHALDRLAVEGHRARPVVAIRGRDGLGHGDRVDQHVRDHGADVVADRLEVIGDGEPERLAGLRHQVRGVDDRSVKRGERLGGAAAQQGRDRARVQAPGAQDHDIGALDGGDDAGWRRSRVRLHGDARHAAGVLARGRLAAGDRSVGVVDDEGEALRGGREHDALDPQEAARAFDALAEAAGHVGERSDDEVADRVVVQLGAALEPVLEDLGQPAPLGQRDQAPAHVAGGRDPELLAQSPTRPAVVGDRDHGGEVAAVEVAQAAEQHGQARAPAERHHAETSFAHDAAMLAPCPTRAGWAGCAGARSAGTRCSRRTR